MHIIEKLLAIQRYLLRSPAIGHTTAAIAALAANPKAIIVAVNQDQKRNHLVPELARTLKMHANIVRSRVVTIDELRQVIGGPLILDNFTLASLCDGALKEIAILRGKLKKIQEIATQP